VTLIVGVLCSDGVVLAADSAVTLGSSGNHSTIRQSARKLTIFDRCGVIGVSGPVGLSQRFGAEVEEIWRRKVLSGKQPVEVLPIVGERLKVHIVPELQAAQYLRGVTGDVTSALSTTVLAIPVAKKPRLFSFDNQGAGEMASEDVPFVAIGSGQPIADPFLAFLKRVFWKSAAPTIADGIFAATWVLDHAIETNPGGVAAPVQIVVLRGSDCLATELKEDDLMEVRQSINIAEQRLATFRDSFFTDTGVAENSLEPPVPGR
jgi:20S proteasome alpha/beta subunit